METQANPFAVKTPETLTPAEIVELFVPYPEFAYLQDTGHQFLHGHRGSGKSMMLKMMEPECQSLLAKTCIEDLPYFGTYLSIKTTEINQPEFERLEQETGGFVLSEHVLATKVLSGLIASTGRFVISRMPKDTTFDSVREFVLRDFAPRLEMCGWTADRLKDLGSISDASEAFNLLAQEIDRLHAETIRYVKSRAFVSTPLPYTGALLGFQDAILPIVRSLQRRGLIPSCPVYILIDDADNLTEQQTRVLNTWVSYRSTDVISLKISTQLSYKTTSTSGGTVIEAPHDFSEIYFTSVRTGSVRDGYPDLVADIVGRRLRKSGLPETQARDFFPPDEVQEAAVRLIAKELKSAWAAKAGGGYRASDDAYRLARPEYIRRLGGQSKQSATYKYAGFEQLVHVSSGIIRFFLDTAARMFAEELKKSGGEKISRISPVIQDAEIRRQSNDLFLGSFEQLQNEMQRSGAAAVGEVKQLRNLIEGIGFLFHARLMDENASERRVFSFYLSDQPNDCLQRLLSLGVRYGYLYKDSITRKEGRGRVVLYVLTRRLAPAFRLDPSGFSHHLSVTGDYLLGLSENPRTYVRRLKIQSGESMQRSLLYGEEL
jgi:hypothetical protein